MTANGWIQIGIYAAILLALARPLGGYMTGVFEGRIGFLRPVERGLYALSGVDERQEQHWLTYGIRNAAVPCGGFRAALRAPTAPILPALQPAGPGRTVTDLAFNTAVSFTTNTNWQSYSRNRR